ncbi:MAG: hypothetical protein MZW92_39235 [Comamonadaceae bacterium]|nr:hypothetical protein [Comamonadaceae bacterium]
MKPLMRRIERHRQRLRPPGLVERNIGMPLDALLHIPIGFTVANDADTGRHRLGNMFHINYV